MRLSGAQVLQKMRSILDVWLETGHTANLWKCGYVGTAMTARALELLHHPAEGGMLSILDLDPAGEATGAVGAVTVLRHQPFEAHQAGVTEQIRPDLALFERRQQPADNCESSHRKDPHWGKRKLKRDE